MRWAASQGGGVTCGDFGALADGRRLAIRPNRARAGWKPFAAQDKPALPVVARVVARRGNYNAATIFRASAEAIGLMI